MFSLPRLALGVRVRGFLHSSGGSHKGLCTPLAMPLEFSEEQHEKIKYELLNRKRGSSSNSVDLHHAENG